MEQEYSLKKDWQASGASSTDTSFPMTGNFRAKELTPRANKTSFRCSRKASIDIASDFFRNSFIRTPQSLSSLPPFRADLNKAAENTRNLMNEITFMKEKSNVNSNSNFQSPSSSTINPQTRNNNIPMGNGINSRGMNSQLSTNGNGNIKCDGFPETVDVGTTINSRVKPTTAPYGDTSTLYSKTNGGSGDMNTNNTEKSQLTNNANSDNHYPTIGQGKRSHSQQIIATPHQPCCECLGCRGGMMPGDSMGDVTTENANKGAPICVLFAIFLLVSIVVISCVMVYLKAGKDL